MAERCLYYPGSWCIEGCALKPLKDINALEDPDLKRQLLLPQDDEKAKRTARRFCKVQKEIGRTQSLDE